MIPIHWLAVVGHFLAVNGHEIGRCYTWASIHHKYCAPVNGYR